MKVTIKTEGFRQMEAALGEFSKATARNVLRRAGMAALEPVADAMRAKAPVQQGGDEDLKDSIAVSAKLNPRQKRLNRDPSVVEIYAGPAGRDGGSAPPQGVQQEFGNENHGPQPFGRPAWDERGPGLLPDLGEALGGEIDKATARAQRKALRVKG